MEPHDVKLSMKTYRVTTPAVINISAIKTP